MDTSFYHISEKAVERVANEAVLTVPGVRDLDAKLAGLAGRSFPRIDVHLDRGSAVAAIDAEIATTYPAPVAAITDAVRATIIEHVRQLCGLDVSRVNVTVSNVEADPSARRVSWDDVAHHDASPTPTRIRVTPSTVTQPVTKKRKPLTAIDVHSLVDDMRDVTVPAPPEVEHIEAPEPAPVQASGFVGAPLPLEEIVVAEPVEVRVPMVPPAREVAPIQVSPSEIHSVSAPEPHPISPVEVAPLRQLTPVTLDRRVRIEPVSLPPRQPLQQILVDRPPLVPVQVPAPMPLRPVGAPHLQRVYHPTAPAPAPLKQITIRPVEKYYDRTR
ncbi:Asp23/Gls24 family envelope stress response protein [Corynebacterium sp. TA-R-1]|uniref:Asp23/Gls24 family envelope stress response protein n=1 Tax=Corynebacterium stercoris TaxID=2943490 RepID=A0ABT1G1H4_9CORY|nr:Asp23/Gls24 family envelope stress response protein [Corynebacterium stercoris]MCP1387874.1 Asp23/Gls24 family envelope stress response protein [Corynebacterium stercoris]